MFLYFLFQLFLYPRYVYLICQTRPSMTSFVTPKKNKFHNCHVHAHSLPPPPEIPCYRVASSFPFVAAAAAEAYSMPCISIHIRSVAHVSFVYALDKYWISSFQQKTTPTHTQIHKICGGTRIQPPTHWHSFQYSMIFCQISKPPTFPSYIFSVLFYMVCMSVCVCICIGVLHFMHATFMRNLFANVACDLINL